MPKTPRLTKSAIRYYSSGQTLIITGKRHSDVIKKAAAFGIKTDDRATQGFMNDDNIFYEREVAKGVALAAGQIDTTHKGELFSEDLW